MNLPDPNTLNYSKSNNPNAKKDLLLIIEHHTILGLTIQETTTSFFNYMKHWNVTTSV